MGKNVLEKYIFYVTILTVQAVILVCAEIMKVEEKKYEYNF